MNRGAAVVGSDLLLICNPDIVVAPGAVERLRSVLSGDERIGAVGPALLDDSGAVVQSARAFPTLRGSWQQAFVGLLRPAGGRSRRYRERNWALARGGLVDWVTGACVLARADAFREIGGFDEGYFLYVEEVDFCWRLKQAGWLVGYEPRARVEHAGAASTSAHPYRAIVAHHRSLWRFVSTTSEGADRVVLPLVALALVLRCGIACAIRALRGVRRGTVTGHVAPPQSEEFAR